MSDSNLKNIGEIIVLTPGNCGGRPRIDGRRIEVRSIVGYHKVGESPEEIVEHYRDLNVAYVYAALAFYYVNKNELDKEFLELDHKEDALERENLRVLEHAH